MKWIKRAVVGSCVAAASLLSMPAVAGAQQCITTQSMTEPGGCVTPPNTPVNTVTPPPVNAPPVNASPVDTPPPVNSVNTGTVAASAVTPASNALPDTAPSPDTVAAAATTPASTSSLPFTGADVEELAGLGIAAVVVGGVLVRRRRRSAV